LHGKNDPTGATKGSNEFSAVCHPQSQKFAASCRNWRLSAPHAATGPERIGGISRQTSSLSTARGHDRSRKCCAKFARNSRERFNAAKRHLTWFNISRSCRWNRPATPTQDKRMEAAKSEISQGTRYPVQSHCFCGSLKSRRWPREVPRDGHAMNAKHPARHPAKCFA